MAKQNPLIAQIVDLEKRIATLEQNLMEVLMRRGIGISTGGINNAPNRYYICPNCHQSYNMDFPHFCHGSTQYYGSAVTSSPVSQSSSNQVYCPGCGGSHPRGLGCGVANTGSFNP